MKVIYQKDHRSGITYAYEATYYWDKEAKKHRSKRKLIGRLNEETGEVIPTDGRCRKLSPTYDSDEDAKSVMPRTLKEYRVAYQELLEENKRLQAEIDQLHHENNS